MKLDELLNKFPDKIKTKIKELYEKNIKAKMNPDIALVRAFNPVVVGKDSFQDDIVKSLVKNLKGHIDYDQWKVEKDTINPENVANDGEFYYVPVTLTVSGVNKNGAYKSIDTIKETAKAQDGWIIPSINDHMEDWVWDEKKNEMVPRVEPFNHEISGVTFGLHGEDRDDGEYVIRGIDMIPMGNPELLENYGVSIGYICDFKDEAGVYKDTEYWFEQTNLRIVHNARMINQRPSIPEKLPPPGQAWGAGYNDQHLAQASPPEGALGEEEPIRPKGDMNTMEGDEKKDQEIADLRKQVQDLTAQLKAKEDSALQDRLKASEDRVQELENQLQASEKKVVEMDKELPSLRKAKEELDAIRQSRRDALVKKFKDAFPDFTDEEISKRSDEWLMDLLKVKTGDAEFDTVPPAEGSTAGRDSKPKLEDKRGVWNPAKGEWEGGLEI